MCKILYVCRLFSGLEHSVTQECWSPTGVPTIYKLIEHLREDDFDCKFIFAAKGGYSSYKATKNQELQVCGFKRSITVLHSHHNIEHKFTGRMWREFCHFYEIAKTAFKFRPKLIYIDHGNIWSAGLLARFTPFKIVFRLMGVYPAMRAATESANPSVSQRILRWLYKSPFSLVICTQDGSGIENWLLQNLRTDVRVKKLLNGIPENLRCKDDNQNGSIVVTFLGKLEEAKGARQFVQAMCKVLRSGNQTLKVNVIGFGSLRQSLIDLVKSEGHEDVFSFQERVPHKVVSSILNQTDIYVSLNRLGNLSNANLEAISAGCCMIIPKSQPQTGVDLYTDDFLPDTAVWRIENTDDINGLCVAIHSLAIDKSRRENMRSAVLKVGRALDSWDIRIKKEGALLKSLMKD